MPPEACRIDVGNLGQVQDDLGLAALDELRDGGAKGLVTFPDQDLPLQVENDDVAHLALGDLHGAFS